MADGWRGGHRNRIAATAPRSPPIPGKRVLQRVPFAAASCRATVQSLQLSISPEASRVAGTTSCLLDIFWASDS